MLDPCFIGMGIEQDKDVICKAVTKDGADEKVASFTMKDGKVNILEHDEITPLMAKEKDRNGRLKYNLGSIMVYLFKVSKLLDICKDSEQLNKMYHKHSRIVPVWIEEMQKSDTPEKDNAYKFELFVHNCLSFVDKEKFGLLVVEREDEFAPVKNGPGSEADSPDTARQLLTEYHMKLFTEAGGQFSGEGDFEIDTLLTYDGEGLEQLAKERAPFQLPGYLRENDTLDDSP